MEKYSMETIPTFVQVRVIRKVLGLLQKILIQKHLVFFHVQFSSAIFNYFFKLIFRIFFGKNYFTESFYLLVY